MGKVIGILLLFIGIAGYLYDWMSAQKMRERKVEEFLVFLHKVMFAMDTENIKIIPYFLQYKSEADVLNDSLQEIAYRLQQNIYPKGQSVWEEVFMEKEQNWALDEETFGFMIHAGNGFFGKNRSENICFLQKSIKEIELQEKKNKEKNAQERKVWIPVGMLSGIMIAILFV